MRIGKYKKRQKNQINYKSFKNLTQPHLFYHYANPLVSVEEAKGIVLYMYDDLIWDESALNWLYQIIIDAGHSPFFLESIDSLAAEHRGYRFTITEKIIFPKVYGDVDIYSDMRDEISTCLVVEKRIHKRQKIKLFYYANEIGEQSANTWQEYWEMANKLSQKLDLIFPNTKLD